MIDRQKLFEMVWRSDLSWVSRKEKDEKYAVKNRETETIVDRVRIWNFKEYLNMSWLVYISLFAIFRTDCCRFCIGTRIYIMEISCATVRGIRTCIQSPFDKYNIEDKLMESIYITYIYIYIGEEIWMKIQVIDIGTHRKCQKMHRKDSHWIPWET